MEMPTHSHTTIKKIENEVGNLGSRHVEGERRRSEVIKFFHSSCGHSIKRARVREMEGKDG
jgi:hypothetical protein